MFRTILTAAALTAIATPAIAAERTFTSEGVTFVYTVTEGKDARVIKGKTSYGSEFELTVHKGHVDGVFDGKQVTFREPKPKAGTVTVASR